MKKASQAKPNKKLVSERLHHNWSQQALADKINTTRINVSRWEGGITVPGPYFRHQLCLVFGKSAEELELLPHREVSGRSLPADQSDKQEEIYSVSVPSSSLYGLPYQRNPLFTGRSAILSSLHEVFFAHRQSTVTQVIYGLGGVGKTQLVLEYAYRYQAEYQAILWATADKDGMRFYPANEKTVFAHWKPIHEELQQELTVDHVLERLKAEKNWLLILDDMDDCRIMEAILACNHNGHILFTTRLQTTCKEATSAHVFQQVLLPMDEEEAILLLLRRAKQITMDVSFENIPGILRDYALEIVQTMGALPLALDQVGAYIEETTCMLPDYLNLYRILGVNLLDSRGFAKSDHPESVVQTLSLILEKLEEENTLASEILQLCAFFHHQSIPEIFLFGPDHLGTSLDPAPAIDVSRIEAALDDLSIYSLIYRDSEGKVFHVHRLVQCVQVNRMSKSLKEQRKLQAVKILAHFFPDGTFLTWPLCEDYLPHAYTYIESLREEEVGFPEAASLLHHVAYYLCGIANYEKSQFFYLRALEVYKKSANIYGFGDIKCTNDIICLYIQWGRYSLAESLCQQVLTSCEHLLSADHPLLSQSLQNVALLHLMQGEYAEAKAVCQQALAIQQRVSIADNTEIAISLSILAQVLCKQEEYTQSEELWQQALGLYEQVFDVNHPLIAQCLNGLADLYYVQEMYMQAETICLRGLAIRENILSANHPDIAVSIHTLARVYYKQGKYDQVEKLCQRAITMYEQTFGLRHPLVVQSLNDLAELYCMNEKYVQAEAACQQALSIGEQVFVGNHPDRIASRVLLARIYEKQGVQDGPLLEDTVTQNDSMILGDTISIQQSSGDRKRKRFKNRRKKRLHKEKNLPTYLSLFYFPYTRRSTDSQKKMLKRIFTPGTILLAIACSMLFLYGLQNSQTVLGNLHTPIAMSQTVSMQKELNLEEQCFQQEGIGISDGRFIFDTYAGRTDLTLKKRFASQLQAGDMSGAVNSMTQAISTDVTDGEVQIYNENLHVRQSGSPYVTIVLGVAIDENPVDLIRARSIMDAAFLVQRRVNDGGELPDGLRLRILIDNVGIDNANVAMVAQFVANRVRNGNSDHIIAVVGWPYSSQTINALDIITGVRLPMVSQTASSVALSGSSNYFFRVNPTDKFQGIALGRDAVDRLHAKTILVLEDPKDPYSVSLANAFSNSARAENVNVIADSSSLFMERETTVVDYQHLIMQAVFSKHVDLIFIAGFDVDAIRLAHAIGNVSRANTEASAVLANLHVLSGDAVATDLIIGVGGGPDAMIAKQYPQDMQHIIFSAFAHPAEWDAKHIPADQQPSFFADWSRIYQSTLRGSKPFVPDAYAILTSDAVQVIVKAASLVHGALTGEEIRNALASLGKGSVPAFQGVSGRIVFDNQGDPVDKAIVMLDVEEVNGGNQVVLKQIFGTLN